MFGQPRGATGVFFGRREGGARKAASTSTAGGEGARAADRRSGGVMRYSDGPNQYSDNEMWIRTADAAALAEQAPHGRYLDILVTHMARGDHGRGGAPLSPGLSRFRPFLERFRPRYTFTVTYMLIRPAWSRRRSIGTPWCSTPSAIGWWIFRMTPCCDSADRGRSAAVASLEAGLGPASPRRGLRYGGSQSERPG